MLYAAAAALLHATRIAMTRLQLPRVHSSLLGDALHVVFQSLDALFVRLEPVLCQFKLSRFALEARIRLLAPRSSRASFFRGGACASPLFLAKQQASVPEKIACKKDSGPGHQVKHGFHVRRL